MSSHVRGSLPWFQIDENNKEKQGDKMAEFLCIEKFYGDSNSLCNQENDDYQ